MPPRKTGDDRPVSRRFSFWRVEVMRMHVLWAGRLPIMPLWSRSRRGYAI